MPYIKTPITSLPIRATLALTALILSPMPLALAADWGYDDMPPAPAAVQAEQTKARPTGQKAAQRAAARGGQKGRKPGAGSPQAQAKAPAGTARTRPARGNESDETSLTPPETKPEPQGPTPEEIAARKKVEELKSWMEIWALAASSSSEDDRNQILRLGTIQPETRKKLEALTFEKLEQNVPEYTGIGAVWAPIREKITADMDYKDSYRLLFRALLRHAASRIEPTAPEAEAIQEILGPARIAEMGPPMLTEDAINAYSDMTCFLYQKRHPDHTVEGDENRQIFAEVIRQRYNEAPNPQAKKAMCNFDVTWASFRCRYLDANDSEREKLVATIEGKDSNALSDGGATGERFQPTGSEKANGNQPNSGGQSPGKTGAAALGKRKGAGTAALISPKLLKIFALGPWAEGSKTIPVAVKMNQMSSPTK